MSENPGSVVLGRRCVDEHCYARDPFDFAQGKLFTSLKNAPFRMTPQGSGDLVRNWALVRL